MSNDGPGSMLVRTAIKDYSRDTLLMSFTEVNANLLLLLTSLGIQLPPQFLRYWYQFHMS